MSSNFKVRPEHAAGLLLGCLIVLGAVYVRGQFEKIRDQADDKASLIISLDTFQKALVKYTHTSGGHLPPMDNPIVVKEALKPYVSSEYAFQFGRKSIILPNKELSHRLLSSIHGPVIAFYESDPPLGEERWAILLDGRIQHYSRQQWKKSNLAVH